jgi:multidrug transporter EmrE-like cation transporter
MVGPFSYQGTPFRAVPLREIFNRSGIAPARAAVSLSSVPSARVALTLMHDRVPAPARPIPAPGLFWNPYLQIFLTVLLTAAAQILLKIGADGSSADDSLGSWLGFRELGSGWTWLGILGFVASFGGWLYALRFLPLGVAFALTNGVHIFVPLGCWLFLGEHIGLLRGSGIMVIIAGILLLAQSVARAEERV